METIWGMADDQYLLPVPEKPEQTQLPEHPKEQRRGKIAIAVACLAAAFTLWQRLGSTFGARGI